MYKIVNMIMIIIAFMHATAASMHTQTRECAFSLIILFTYCILPINGHKKENKSIKLTCCVLLASKFVDITEISLALFMEADAGWYNTEKMELSSSFSNIDPTMLCHMVNVDTQFRVSFLANSASVQSHATHFRAQSKSCFPSNFSKCFSSWSRLWRCIMQRFCGTLPKADWDASTTTCWSAILVDNFLPRSLISVTTPHAKFGITINCPCGKHSIERVEHMWCAYQKYASF